MFIPKNEFTNDLFAESTNGLPQASTAASENPSLTKPDNIPNDLPSTSNLTIEEFSFEASAVSDDGTSKNARDSTSEGFPRGEAKKPRDLLFPQLGSSISLQDNDARGSSTSRAPCKPMGGKLLTPKGKGRHFRLVRLISQSEYGRSIAGVERAPVRDTPARLHCSLFDAARTSLNDRKGRTVSDGCIETFSRPVGNVATVQVPVSRREIDENVWQDFNAPSDDSDKRFDLGEMQGQGKLAKMNARLSNCMRMQATAEKAKTRLAALKERECDTSRNSSVRDSLKPVQAPAIDVTRDPNHMFSFATLPMSADISRSHANGGTQTDGSQTYGHQTTSKRLRRAWGYNKLGHTSRGQQRDHIEILPTADEGTSLVAEGNSGQRQPGLWNNEHAKELRGSEEKYGCKPQDVPRTSDVSRDRAEEPVSVRGKISCNPLRASWWRKAFGRRRTSQQAERDASRQVENDEDSAEELEWLNFSEARQADLALRWEARRRLSMNNSAGLKRAHRPALFFPELYSDGSLATSEESVCSDSDGFGGYLSVCTKLEDEPDEMEVEPYAKPTFSAVTPPQSEILSTSSPPPSHCKTDTVHMQCPIIEQNSFENKLQRKREPSHVGLWRVIFRGSRE